LQYLIHIAIQSTGAHKSEPIMQFQRSAKQSSSGKPWSPCEPSVLERLPGHMGAYELADADGTVLLIGYAGGRSRFGMRGEIAVAVERIPGAVRFRYEVTTAYLSRFQELLMVHQSDFGRLPSGNAPEPGLGRLSPGSTALDRRPRPSVMDGIVPTARE
jgi:hypothetical protein